MKKNIEASKIDLLEIFLPTFLVIKNCDFEAKYIFNKINSGSKILLKDLNIKNENQINTNYLKKELIKTISSLLAVNIIYFKDDNLEDIITEIKTFLNSDLITDNNLEKETKEELYLYFLPIIKEIKTFHLGLLYADIIKKEKKFILEENLINHILSSMLKLENKNNDFLKKEIKLKTKIYNIALTSFFDNIIKNDKILNEYINNQEIYIKEIDLNYKKLFQELEKTIEYIIN